MPQAEDGTVLARSLSERCIPVTDDKDLGDLISQKSASPPGRHCSRRWSTLPG